MSGCTHSSSVVVNSRKRELYVIRRRQCHKCGERYNTIEIEVPEMKHGESALEACQRYWAREKLERYLEELS